MSDPKYDLSIMTPWILGSLIAYVVALVLTLTLVVPALRDAGENAGAAYKRVAMTSGIATRFWW